MNAPRTVFTQSTTYRPDEVNSWVNPCKSVGYFMVFLFRVTSCREFMSVDWITGNVREASIHTAKHGFPYCRLHVTLPHSILIKPSQRHRSDIKEILLTTKFEGRDSVNF